MRYSLGNRYKAMFKNSSKIREFPQIEIDVTTVLDENVPGSTSTCKIVLVGLPELQLHKKFTIAVVNS